MSLSPRAEPFLWIHLAGLATAPLWAALFLFAIANPDPFLPSGFTAILAGLIGIGSILWMQLRRPFYIFSLAVLTLKPEALQEGQRKLLRWFLSSLNRILAIATAIGLALILLQLYRWLPIVQLQNPLAALDPFPAFLLAIVTVLALNLFVQVPVSVAPLLWLSESVIAGTEPLAPGQIAQQFTILGLPLKGLLPADWYRPEEASAGADSSPAVPETTPSPAPVETAPETSVQPNSPSSVAEPAEEDGAPAGVTAETEVSPPAEAIAQSTTDEVPEMNDEAAKAAQ
ncbi:low-complexity tail membrane protein [Synechococcus elongatus]|uniref:Low-complexity tail membrane protein n=1 Tax=Synechococcus elongatus PCC 11802 TaxID=2283154 RepID=A0AAT9K0Y4_SYNEL|nr:low-complexity tail membrane protein [Synechococcus elongatus]